MLVPKNVNDVDELTESQAKKLLKKLVEELDFLDIHDVLGTEGWRHRFGLGG